MALGVGSILEFRFFQTYLGQSVLNVQHYIVLAMEVLADDLSDYAQPMFDYWVSNLNAVQSNQLSYVRGEFYEVNGLDFGIYADPTPGTGIGTFEPLPSYVSVGVQHVRASRATRHGWKRFSGITEAQVDGNALTSAYLSAWQAAIDGLFPPNQELVSSEFPETRSINVQPIIWGGNDPAFPLGRYSLIEESIVKPNVTTQNTRKAGRGD